MKKIGFGKKKYVVMTEDEYKNIREELYEAAYRLFALKTGDLDEDALKRVNEIDDAVENARDILRC